MTIIASPARTGHGQVLSMIRPGLSNRTAAGDFLTALERVRSEAPGLAATIVERFRETSPDYAELSATELLPGVERNIHQALAAVAEVRGATAAEQAETERLAEERARQGIGVDALLLAYRLGIEVAWERFLLHARELRLPAEQLLAGSERLRAWADELTIITTRAHRRTDIEISQRDHEQRAEFVRALVAGTLEAPQLRSKALLYGLDINKRYLLARGRTSDAMWRVERALRATDPGALVALVDGDMVGVLSTRPRTAGDGVVGLGPPVRLDDAARSFGLASRALEAAAALGWRGVCGFDDVGLQSVILSEHDLGAQLVARYVAPLAEAGHFGHELSETVTAWLEAGTGPQRVASALHIHRNTLRYRLARYEEMTGCDLSSMRTRVEAWWAFQRARLVEDPPGTGERGAGRTPAAGSGP